MSTTPKKTPEKPAEGAFPFVRLKVENKVEQDTTPPPKKPISLVSGAEDTPPTQSTAEMSPAAAPQSAVQKNPEGGSPPPLPRPDAARRESILDEKEKYNENLPMWVKIFLWVVGGFLFVLLGDFLFGQKFKSHSPLVEHLEKLEQRAIAAEASATSASAETKRLQLELQESQSSLERAKAKTEEWKAYAKDLEESAEAAGFKIEGK